MQPPATLKSEPSFDGCSNTSFPTGSLIKNENGHSNEIPLLVSADWSSQFLPTLYHVLFCSEKPFHEFSKGMAFFTTIQKILDKVHPGNSYVITSQSKMYTMVQYYFHSSDSSMSNCFSNQAYDWIIESGLILACMQ